MKRSWPLSHLPLVSANEKTALTHTAHQHSPNQRKREKLSTNDNSEPTHPKMGLIRFLLHYRHTDKLNFVAYGLQSEKRKNAQLVFTIIFARCLEFLYMQSNYRQSRLQFN